MPGPSCFKCQLFIDPRTSIASYENHTYHPQCLVCKICKKSVSGEKFLKDEDQNLICAKCDSIYGPKCIKCNESFKPGQPYKKLEENVFYHYECFTCLGPCKKPIAGEFYDLDDGKFICTDCYNKFGPDSIQSEPSIVDTSAKNKEPSLNEKVNSSPLLHEKPNDDVNNLSSTFKEKLNTNTATDQHKNDTSKLPNNSDAPTKSSRFDNSGSKDDSSKKVLTCEKCGLSIQGAYSVYNEKSYHPKCFVCSRCQNSFKDRQFFKLDGLPICSECHESNLLATSSKCKVCQKPIVDNILTFMNEEYHEYCLTCTSCHIKLLGVSIYTDKQKNAYCVDCFTKKEAKKCEKCAKVIAPNQSNIIFEEKPYHKECFICGSCSRQISVDETFFKNTNGEICCEECAKMI